MEKHYSPGRTWESMARGLASLAAPNTTISSGRLASAASTWPATGDRTGTASDCDAGRSWSFVILDLRLLGAGREAKIGRMLTFEKRKCRGYCRLK